MSTNPKKKQCTTSAETKLKHATENIRKAMAAVQDLELKLEVML